MRGPSPTCLRSIQGICGCRTNVTHFTPFSDVSTVKMQIFIRKVEVLSGQKCSFCNFSNREVLPGQMAGVLEEGVPSSSSSRGVYRMCAQGLRVGAEDPGSALGCCGVL